jgi:heme exporter protein A
VAIGGHDASKAGAGLRRAIGFLGHQTFLYDDLTAEENLLFYGRMYDVPDLAARIDETLTDVGLEHRRHDRVRVFSRGMQQRLSLARAIVHRPPLLLLDEPDSGLDPEATRTLRRLLQDVQVPDRSIVLATHDFEFAYEMADRFVILVAGRLMWEGVKDDLDGNGLPERYRDTIQASLDRGR